MATLTLKNVPKDLHRKLKERAELHQRSLNREAIECLRAAVMVSHVNPESLIALARQLRARVRSDLTQTQLTELKRSGRP